MSRIPGLSRAVGTAAGSTLALALLVCCCVFAAIAGPALSLHTRSQALHQTLAGLAATSDAVQVTAQWYGFISALYPPGHLQYIKRSELDQASREIGQGFSALGLRLAPGGRWAGLSVIPSQVSGTGPRAIAALPPRLEVVYRDTLTSNARVVAGTYATSLVPAGAVGVAATTQMAYRFGLHPGSRMQLQVPDVGPVTLLVTAIVAERAPASAFWTQDPTVGAPSLSDPAINPYWVGGVIADPDQFTAMQNAFGGDELEMNWEFPLAVGSVNADAAQGLYDALNSATNTEPALTGALQRAAHTLTVTSPLIANLLPFLDAQAAIETVLLLLFVSLIVIGATVILIAARMMVARRDAELAMLRNRGGSLRQVAGVMAGGAVLAALPGALAGAALASAVIPGGAVSSAAGWWLAGVAVAVALAGPPLVAAWQHRKPAPANPALTTTAETGRPRVAWRRPVAELTGCAAAAAGLVVLHDQGVPAGGGIDLYLTITPVLVAIPVVVIMLRLYPLAVRALLRLSARSTGATGFVAMSRAARSPLTGVLPAFALVLALSLATFAGMTSNGITRGEIAASWHTTGADAVIDAGPLPVTSSALRAISAVRGVRHVSAAWTTNWVTPPPVEQPVTVIAVDPASYAALVASTPFPAFPAGAIVGTPGGVRSSGPPVPVLASPAAAAILGTGPTQLSSSSPEGPFTVRVTGTIGDTPAEPGGGTYVVMPLERLPGPTGRPAPNVVLVTGSGIDNAELSAVISRMVPGGLVTFRSQVLGSLASSPLQHGAVLIIGLTIATAAAFGLFIVMLGLALGSAERELTLARLTVMGHERETRLVLFEAMPALIAAVVAGAACALALPHVVGSSIDLSAFTGTNAPVQLQPDAVALGLPAAGILILALAVLTGQARGLRRRGITGMLRAQ
jgi:putative ABC transport system permease protein